MTDLDGRLAAELDRMFPASPADPDWRAIRRRARRRRTRATLAAVGGAAVVFGVVPALGVGRDLLWLQSNEHPEYGYTYATVETPRGHKLEFRASRGMWLGLSTWLDGRLVSAAGGPDERLHGIGHGGPRYVIAGVSWNPRGVEPFQAATGPIANEVRAVEVVLRDGTTRRATIVQPPKTIHTDLRFFYIVLAPNPAIASVTARGEAGRILERYRVFLPGSFKRTYHSPAKRRG